MKLIIKTRDIEIEYQDDYSMLEAQAKDRIESLISLICSVSPTPVITTVEEFFKTKQK